MIHSEKKVFWCSVNKDWSMFYKKILFQSKIRFNSMCYLSLFVKFTCVKIVSLRNSLKFKSQLHYCSISFVLANRKILHEQYIEFPSFLVTKLWKGFRRHEKIKKLHINILINRHKAHLMIKNAELLRIWQTFDLVWNAKAEKLLKCFPPKLSETHETEYFNRKIHLFIQGFTNQETWKKMWCWERSIKGSNWKTDFPRRQNDS